MAPASSCGTVVKSDKVALSQTHRQSLYVIQQKYLEHTDSTLKSNTNNAIENYIVENVMF